MNSATGFDPSIQGQGHSRILGANDEAVLNKVLKKIQKNTLFKEDIPLLQCGCPCFPGLRAGPHTLKGGGGARDPPGPDKTAKHMQRIQV
jgi:hypothetical protein